MKGGCAVALNEPCAEEGVVVVVFDIKQGVVVVIGGGGGGLRLGV